MIYVALLRGINVGGKNKINMKELKESFEHVGMQSVTTYINSGNIIFENSVHSKEEITTLLQNAIQADFSLEIKVLLRDFNEMEDIMENLPEHWKNDKEMKSDVMFLWDEIDGEDILKEINVKSEFETVIHVPGAILWSVPKKLVTKSGMIRLVSSPHYKKITIRNVNTTRKIYELMKESSEQE